MPVKTHAMWLSVKHDEAIAEAVRCLTETTEVATEPVNRASSEGGDREEFHGDRRAPN